MLINSPRAMLPVGTASAAALATLVMVGVCASSDTDKHADKHVTAMKVVKDRTKRWFFIFPPMWADANAGGIGGVAVYKM
jgi:hypothetical protein